MDINVSESYVNFEDFKKTFEETTNIKDVHLICRQAGCPVYIVRNTEDKCCVMWHPCIDSSKDVIVAKTVDGLMQMYYKGNVDPFESVEALQSILVMKCMIGDNPFEEKFCVWKRS